MEALVSNRANYLADILATRAIEDILINLPRAYKNPEDMQARETMLNASMVAGLAFTNVSLGIVHSMAHTLGSYFGVSHGLADAVILPYIIEFNYANPEAKKIYDDMAEKLGVEDMSKAIFALNKEIGIAHSISEIVEDEDAYMAKLHDMAECAKADGCTKTNPVIPSVEQFEELFVKVYKGE